MLEDALQVDADGFVVTVGRCPSGGFATTSGPRTPARMGEMTWSRRASKAAMLRSASDGT